MASNNDNGLDDWEDVPVSASADGIDDWKDVSDSPAPVQASSNIDPLEALKTAFGGAAGYAAGTAVSPIVEKGANAFAEKLIDPNAERLAYRGAGGYSGTKAGMNLNQAMVNKDAGSVASGI